MNTNEIKDNSNFKMRSFCDISQIREIVKNENSNEINVIKENKLNKNKDNKNKENNSSANNSNQKEEIVFFTIQKCPKCQKDNQINNISEMIHHRISQKRDHIFYKCSGCGESNLEVYIKYKLSLNNKKKNESILISHGQFKLIPPHKIYQKLKEKFLNLKDYKLDIDHIFSYDDIYLLNNIFYFSDRMLPFDFLIPYEGRDDRDYFMEEEEEEEDDNIINNKEDKKEEISKINEGFSVFNSNDNNFSIIGKE
jgi:DNA-directed RNA polymerase subunit M/transcription elongation factor TFIIS